MKQVTLKIGNAAAMIKSNKIHWVPIRHDGYGKIRVG
jgi:hypothetical protein